ncbi:hypothetical protein A3B32_02940 [Candidatus Uhrbacteria bacterium RIFCSPLOWO2_01_FULL_53_9]|uniref:Tellurite resistance methyltransferase TehB-like domain-containing protein n=3 Tax=Candidatus Uhriibacteriota TaxID=1752732 RepID=A0A1F7UYL8_9BACT|nr:MAG: hypothetical protein A3C17_04285 [Candidatus Uhrbacteria bacterium RIFCSPHIGHO2_02_FULL_53_13]OGL83359.1 MAG: hypothetical protein A3B32_02940 [Candidatus Uhrbacteria bacterium RIFCSPLOWO2_01_FULL_53_9]OGL89381.1 MAG: hypothetical protein A3I45_00610 [Candidatus Uhrbacteria bacterium RIFCSPLOWO2_02_FULL_53_10]
MTDKLKSFYDNLYKANPSVFGTSSLEFLKNVFQIACPLVGRALDVGAGEGLTSQYLAEQGFIVNAVDLSECALTTIKQNKSVTVHICDIVQFEMKQSYSFVFIALVAHHLSEDTFHAMVRKIQNNTVTHGLHAYRLFTSNSDFFRQSSGSGFYDNGMALNALYDQWKIVFDEKVIGNAATQDAQNEIRHVVFQKL